jgi:NarL family two-component system response regulator LiaR
MDESIRILIVDDHAVVREGLRALIDVQPDMELAGEAADGVEAIDRAHTLQPDVILLDLVMPRKSGLEAIVEIKEKTPNARILVLTSFAEDDKVFPAIKAGAMGYLLKDSSAQELVQAIRDVYQGEPAMHPSIARKLMRELQRPPEPDMPRTEEPLSGREVEVLTLVAGFPTKKSATRFSSASGQCALTWATFWTSCTWPIAPRRHCMLYGRGWRLWRGTERN